MKKLTKKRAIYVMIAMVVLFILVVAIDYSKSAEKNQETLESGELIQNVKTSLVDDATVNMIKTVGVVKAEVSLDVIALSSGTLRNLNFKIGDQVYKDKILATLQNNSLSTNYSNATISVANIQNNNQSLLRISEESLKQAENGVANALRAVEASKISLQNSKNSLDNALVSQSQNNNNLKVNSVTTFADYVNTINNTLDKINYVIKADGSMQMAGIGAVLGAGSQQSLTTAKSSYFTAKDSYNGLLLLSLNVDSIELDYVQLNNTLDTLKKLIDDVIIVLDNTITSYDFSETSLNAQKDAFTGYRKSTVGLQTSVQQAIQALQNIDINNKRELDSLNSAVEIAENQLNIANIGYDNASSALNNAKTARQQQEIVNKSSYDSVHGQLNLVGTQVADLNVKAPIAGRITKKYVDVGSEVQPGQKIAQVSQDDNIKIELNLSSEDIYKIKIGQAVVVNNEINGSVSLIESVADPVTRKVRVEVLLSNDDGDVKDKLILGTFVDVEIAVEKLDRVNNNSVFVPLKAVTITQNENFVFLVVENKAKKSLIEIGKIQGSLIEIVSGIKKGDQIIIEGNKGLSDNQEVDIE